MAAVERWSMDASAYFEQVDDAMYRDRRTPRPYVDMGRDEIVLDRLCTECGKPFGDHYHYRCWRCRRNGKKA